MSSIVLRQVAANTRRQAFQVLRQVHEVNILTGQLETVPDILGCVYRDSGKPEWHVDHENITHASQEAAVDRVVSRMGRFQALGRMPL